MSSRIFVVRPVAAGGALNGFPEVIIAKGIITQRLVIVDVNQKPCVQLNEAGLGLQDKNGAYRVEFTEAGLSFRHKNDKIGAVLSEIGLGFHDNNGTTRALLREIDLLFLDENGKVIFKAPAE